MSKKNHNTRNSLTPISPISLFHFIMPTGPPSPLSLFLPASIAVYTEGLTTSLSLFKLMSKGAKKNTTQTHVMSTLTRCENAANPYVANECRSIFLLHSCFSPPLLHSGIQWRERRSLGGHESIPPLSLPPFILPPSLCWRKERQNQII